MTIFEGINLGINIVFIVLLLLALLKGFIRGFWKSLVTMIGLVVGLVLLFIFLTPISNFILNLNITALEGTINEYIIGVLSESLTDGEEIVAGGELYMLCSALSLSVVKMVVLLIGTVFIMLITEPLVKLIVRLIFGRDDHEKTLGLRFAGMGVGFVHFMVMALLITLPLAGIVSLANSYKEELAKLDESNEIGLVEGIDQLHNSIPSIIYKIGGDETGAHLLGAVTAVKTNNGTVNVFKEIENAQPLVSIIIKEMDNGEIDYLQLLISNREALAHYVETTNIFETFMPAVIEVLELKDTLNDSPITIEDLKAIDFKNDKKDLAQAIIAIGNFMENLDLEDMDALLGNPKLPETLKAIGEALKDTTIIDLILDVVQNVIDEALVDAELGLAGVVDVTSIDKTHLPDELERIGLMVNSIYNLGLLDDEPGDILDNSEELKNLIDTTLDLELIKGQEKEVIGAVLDKTGLKDSLAEVGIIIDLENVDWAVEKENIANIMESFANANNNIPDFDATNVMEYLKDDTTRPYVGDFLKSMVKTDLIDKTVIIDSVETELDNMGINTTLNRPSDIDWESEMDQMLTILKYADQMDDIINDYENNVEEIGEILEAVTSSEILNPVGKEVISSVMNETNVAVDLTDLDINKVESWSSEVETLLELKDNIDSGTVDINNLTAESIDKIINTAAGEEGNNHIASHVVGSVIHEELKNYLNEENHKELVENFDLRNPENLKNAQEEINTAVVLYKELDNLSAPEELDAEAIDTICDAYATLDKGTVLTDVIAKTVAENVGVALDNEQLDNISFEQEATILKDVLTAYANNASQNEIDSLVQKADTETVIVKGIIEQYLK